MGQLRINLMNFITVGLMAFIFVYLASKAFTLVGVKNPVATAVSGS